MALGGPPLNFKKKQKKQGNHVNMGYFVIIQGNFSATKQICTFQIVLCFVDHLFLYMSEKSPSDMSTVRFGTMFQKRNGIGKRDR